MDNEIRHETFVFERRCEASVSTVFDMLADPVKRASWSAPSDTAAFVYEAADWREGGEDIFRCGSKDNPQYTGRTIYISIVPASRIVSMEIVEAGGRKLMASLITTELEPVGAVTDLRMTVQVTSFAGEEMLKGTSAGNNASLDNLVRLVSRS